MILQERVRGLDSMTWKGYDWVEILVGGTFLRGSRIIFLISSYIQL